MDYTENDEFIRRLQERLITHTTNLQNDSSEYTYDFSESTGHPAYDDVTATPTINAQSQGIERDVSIEDHLIAKGREYEKNIAELREKQMYESTKVLSTPQINEHSEELIAQKPIRTKPIHEAVDDILEKREANVKELKEKLSAEEEAEMKKLRFRPQLTKMAQEYERENELIDYFYEWNKMKERSLLSSKKKFDKNINKHIQKGPKISDKTNEIVLKKQKEEYNEGEKVWKKNLPDRLIEYEEGRKQRLENTLRKLQEEQVPASPMITELAQNLDRGEGDVWNRLYDEFHNTSERKSALMQVADSHIPAEYTFSPRINDKSAFSSIRTGKIHEDLYERQNELLQRREEDIQRILEQEEMERQPLLCQKSREIAALLPSSSVERLLSPKKRKATIIREDKEMAELTFSPHLVSKKYDRREHVKDRNLYLYQTAKKRKEDREKFIQTEKEKRFVKPEAKKIPNALAVSDRLSQWAKKKEEKLMKARQAKIKNEVKEMSTPDLSSSRKMTRRILKDKAAKSPGKSPITKFHGVTEHIQRLERARAEKKRKENALKPKVYGDHYVPHMTKPKPFQFTHDNNVSSLRKPVHSLNEKSSPKRSPSKLMALHENSENYSLFVVATSEWIRRSEEKKKREAQSVPFATGDARHTSFQATAYQSVASPTRPKADRVVSSNVSVTLLDQYNLLKPEVLHPDGSIRKDVDPDLLRNYMKIDAEISHYVRLAKTRQRKQADEAHKNKVFGKTASKKRIKLTKPKEFKFNQRDRAKQQLKGSLRRPVEHTDLSIDFDVPDFEDY
ncbi:hypothetical protein PCE1_004694 [Barthelona sp. PCE]